MSNQSKLEHDHNNYHNHYYSSHNYHYDHDDHYNNDYYSSIDYDSTRCRVLATSGSSRHSEPLVGQLP